MFEDLKAGDKVILCQYTSAIGETRSIATIERTTKTQIILTNYTTRFKQSDGDVVSSSGFHPPYIKKATPELLIQVANEQKVRKLVRQLKEVDFSTLKLETLQQIVALIKGNEQV